MSGYWGNNCENPSEIHCVNRVELETGRCAHCSPGYWGDYCNLRCPENCQIKCALFPQVIDTNSIAHKVPKRL